MHGPNNAQSLTKLSNKLSNITNGRVSGVYQLGEVEMILPQIKNWGEGNFLFIMYHWATTQAKGAITGNREVDTTESGRKYSSSRPIKDRISLVTLWLSKSVFIKF